uniref:Uncharacterized protein n=1 Tax=Anopheles culicifacies TaxID=139723 RepID=A0A182M007_9DIPT
MSCDRATSSTTSSKGIPKKAAKWTTAALLLRLLDRLYRLACGLYLRSDLLCRRVHIKLHVPEIINRHVHVKTKYMHVYHPKKIVQEMPPSFVDQQPIDHGMWMPSGAMPSSMIQSPAAALSPSTSSAMAAAAAASLSSMVQDKLSTQLAQELMMRYRNLDAPSVGATTDGDASDYLRDYYRQQRKLSDQLMLQEAMQLPNFAQTKYLSNMGYNWDKSFGVKSSDADTTNLLPKKSKKKKAYGHL